MKLTDVKQLQIGANFSDNPAIRADIEGVMFYPRRTEVSSNISTSVEFLIAVTDTSSARTITLSSNNCVKNRLFMIKDESGGAATNNITIATEGSETIDGASTKVINTNYGSVWVYSDGSNWFTL